MGRPRVYTDEQLLDALRAFGKAHGGRAPFKRERRGMEFGIPSTWILAERFGSPGRAFELAGLRFRTRANQHTTRSDDRAARHSTNVREFWTKADPRAAGVA